ncbi:MAG: FAD-dependent oxidoreductase [Deltaproteobacteria bacterium]|nr:FAD-dependent oxidoreductase [Deltaproteobacteria bacterium]
MTEVSLTIDGRQAFASPDRTILSVATELGIEIPTLCHDPRIKPEVSCWVCVVEVQTNEGTWRIEPACATRAASKLAVRTDSATIRASRRAALELILSDHFADCVAPCVLACPTRVDVPRYVKAVSLGRHAEAVRIVRETNSLPGVCSRVCPHPCEQACSRRLVDAPVAINAIKRLATELAPRSSAPAELPPDTGKRIAIIGAGPAGLSAAHELRLFGHRVSVLDSREQPGGMLRYVIPTYRLPRDVLDADIRALVELGVEFRLGATLGPDFKLSEIIGDQASDRHDAVFLATGAWRQRRLGIKNEDAEGVLGALELLRWVQEGQLSSLEGEVAVLGGGNSAVDAARTARRLGAKRVTIFYRRGRDQMPAFSAEIEAAIEEGIELDCLAAPVEIEVANGRVSGLRLVRMSLRESSEGRPQPVPIVGSEYARSTDWVVSAVGQLADPIGSRGLVNPKTQSTPIEGLFAGGDFVTGPSTVVEAIASGRRAALAIDSYLNRKPVALDGSQSRPATHATPNPFDLGVLSQMSALRPPVAADFAHEPVPSEPIKPRTARPNLRVADFREVELGLGEEEGRQEASRCMSCSCSAFDTCALRPLLSAYGVSQGAYRGTVHTQPARTLRPGLRLEMNKCIRCNRCVSICKEVVGAGVLTLAYRGFETSLEFACSETEARQTCDRCLATRPLCVDTCPTAALTEGSRT